jgi:hypothetical protein
VAAAAVEIIQPARLLINPMVNLLSCLIACFSGSRVSPAARLSDPAIILGKGAVRVTAGKCLMSKD